MQTNDEGRTKERVLAAASELFAERGFHATTARDIAERAGVNLAASHYHYGSKKDLYLEVLRAQFATIRATLARSGAAPTDAELARLSSDELAELLHKRIRIMFDILVGPPPGLHGSLMQWEMTDPSEALPVIVNEFILPMKVTMEQLVAHLHPELDPESVERCVLSIFGQAAFYRFAMPALLLTRGMSQYPPGMSELLARHVSTFSCGGFRSLAASASTRPRSRRQPRTVSRRPSRASSR